jgi:hypothetical protein
MSDTWAIRLTLFLAGVIPFALAGGLSDDTTILPWSAGFLTQAGVVIGMIAQRRGWWSRRIKSNPTRG